MRTELPRHSLLPTAEQTGSTYLLRLRDPERQTEECCTTLSFAKIIQRCCYVNDIPVKGIGGMILSGQTLITRGEKPVPVPLPTNPTRTRTGEQDRKSRITYSENYS
jgi:hypothetical protein